MSTSVSAIVRRAQQTQHGFSDLRLAAEEILAGCDSAEAIHLAEKLYQTNVAQAQMIAVFVYGAHAVRAESAMTFLRDTVSTNADWRVQEILAQAFDRYCRDAGYEHVLPVISDWLRDNRANVRRAVSEGLRIWTARPFFREHPDQAVKLLAELRADESEYVRRSAGNALRDISRKHASLVSAELNCWDLTDHRIAFTHKLASRFLP